MIVFSDFVMVAIRQAWGKDGKKLGRSVTASIDKKFANSLPLPINLMFLLSMHSCHSRLKQVSHGCCKSSNALGGLITGTVKAKPEDP